jgi:hypothetical protein
MSKARSKKNDLPNFLRQSKAARIAEKNLNFARAYGCRGKPDFTYADVEARMLSLVSGHKKGVRVRRCRDGRVQLFIGILSWHLSEKEALKLRGQLNHMKLCGRRPIIDL